MYLKQNDEPARNFYFPFPKEHEQSPIKIKKKQKKSDLGKISFLGLVRIQSAMIE